MAVIKHEEKERLWNLAVRGRTILIQTRERESECVVCVCVGGVVCVFDVYVWCVCVCVVGRECGGWGCVSGYVACESLCFGK